MNVRSMRTIIRMNFSLILLVLIACGIACGPTARIDQGGASATRDAASSSKIITDIVTTEEIDGIGVLLKSDRLLTATSIKQPYPLGVILYLPETIAPELKTIYTPDSNVIKSISSSKLTDDGPGLRLEILLEKEAPYDIVQEDEGLKIVFKTDQDADSSPYISSIEEPSQSLDESDLQPIPEQQPIAVVNTLRAVTATELDDGVNISVQADGTINDFRSSTMASPARIVFELLNVKSPFPTEQMVPIDTKWVKAARYYSYPDRVRLVLETDKAYLNNFSAYAADDGLLINVGSSKALSATDEDPHSTIVTEHDVASQDPPVEKQTPSLQKRPSPKTYKRAWVKRIDFHSDDNGASTIIIGTTHPINYDVSKQDDKQLKVSLFNTRIPKYRRRPLITTRFESAVDRIVPKQIAGAADIAVMLREDVPYNVEQEDKLLKITLEPSKIPPKPMSKTPAVALGDDKTLMSTDDIVGSSSEKAADDASVATETTQKYVGEKISLDFYQTDIKNVFRILREVSQKNFAIDDNVTGKVTLTLDKPVPWDQVLELILKMNSLGMVYEGDIIRIAKLSTLEQEEQQKNDRIAASLEAKKAQAALEPLQTEYIPVNYVKPASILAQIKGILTPERGKAEVHAETHQIVISDVPDVIRKARKIIKKLDLITQQVLIEARIVEVSTDFNRNVGIRWSALGGIENEQGMGGVGAPDTAGKAGIGPQRGFDTYGGTYGYGLISQNIPRMASGTIGLEFTRIITSEFLLSASLTALESSGEGKIISSPKVLTLDGVAATIEQGDSIPYNKVDEAGNTTTEWKDITLSLTVTPQVTRDDRIRMQINLQNDVPIAFGDSIGASTGSVNTELLVNNGETVVIGGIIKSEKTVQQVRIPWLSDIPILGWLFKEQGNITGNTEILIFITPQIVSLEQSKTENL